MPFTFSHPAATLPLAFIPKKYISITGLVIGSMTPDFEYFFRLKHLKTVSHTWSGMFWFDLPLGIALLIVFNVVIRDALIENVPLFLNRRLSRFDTTLGKDHIQRNVLVIIICLLIGIASHLVWDRLTHKTSDIIKYHWEDLYGTIWEANSLWGAAIIAFSIWKLPKEEKTKKDNILPFWSIVLFIALIMVYLYYPFAHRFTDLVIPFISGGLLGLTVASMIDRIIYMWEMKF